MPELPEVEIVVRGLRDTVLNRTIARVRVDAPPGTIFVSDSFRKKRFEDVLRKKKIRHISRRGKNILINLSGGVTLWAHLKMTGHFFYVPASQPIDKHDLVIFDFQDTRKEKPGTRFHLRFNDYRRFGRLRLFHNDELHKQEGLAKLGPEPMEIAVADFISLFTRSRRMVKPALLDQTFIAGLGNIYADESLHCARLHPKKLTSSISRRKLSDLHLHILRLLSRSIRLKGTSVASYAGVDGQAGSFQKHLMVYNREGVPCMFCGRRIVREKIGSRSAYYCPRCQRL